MSSPQPTRTSLPSEFVVRICGLPDRSEPAYVLRLFACPEYVEEIEMYMYAEAYVFFDNAEYAAQAAKAHDGHRYGPSHVACTLSVKVVPPSKVPRDKAPLYKLSDFRREEESAIETRTVRFSKIFGTKPKRNILDMCELEFVCGAGEDEDARCIKIHPEPGSVQSGALARFSSVDAARAMVDEYNGNYWRHATIYARCVPDEDLDDILAAKADPDATPTVKIFISAVKKGTTAADLVKAFKPYKLKDVNVAPGKNVAFVFMSAPEAARLLKQHPKHKDFNGWKYNLKVNAKDMAKLPTTVNVNPAAFEKRDIGDIASLSMQTAALNINNPTPDTHQPAAVKGVHNVRATNVAYYAPEQQVRDFFVGFEVSKITINNGVAIVELSSLEEAERAVMQCNRKKLLGRQVMVQLVASSL